MRNDLFLLEKDLFNESFEDSDLVLLLALNGLIVGDLETNCINLSVLAYAIYGESVNQEKKEIVRKKFLKFEKKGLIKIKQNIDKSTFLCDVKRIFVDTTINDITKNYYVCITKKEFHTLMNIRDEVDNYKLVRLYLCYINTLHKGDLLLEKYKGKIGFMPQSYLAQKSYICERTLQKYNNVLQKYELLFIVHHKPQLQVENSEIKTVMSTNTYSRYADKSLCNEYVRYFKKNFYSPHEYNESLFKREYSQKLIHLLAGREYSLSEKKKIIEYVEAYNDDVLFGVNNGDLIDETMVEEMIGLTKEESLCITMDDTNTEYEDGDIYINLLEDDSYYEYPYIKEGFYEWN